MDRHVLKCRTVESTTASVPPIQQYSPVDMSSVLSDVVVDAVPPCCINMDSTTSRIYLST